MTLKYLLKKFLWYNTDIENFDLKLMLDWKDKIFFSIFLYVIRNNNIGRK